MKLYLIAPIAIAGLVTAAGTASILRAEIGLVKTGQQVASMLDPRVIRLSADSMDSGPHGIDGMARMRSVVDGDGRAPIAPAQPAPMTSVEAIPMSNVAPQAPHARHSRHSRELQTAPILSAAHADQAIPAAALADNDFLPAAQKSKNDFKVFVGPDGKEPFMAINGNQNKFPDVHITFDSKQFEKQQQVLAKQIESIKAEKWNELRDAQLKKLNSYTIHYNEVGPNGATEHLIKIDPMQFASDAEKAALDAASRTQQSSDWEFSSSPGN